jgi:cytidylate kinase
MSGQRIVVAIDGPSGAGKSTVARRVAERLSYLYVDSGAMYRAVALAASEQGIASDDATRMAACAAGLRIDLEKTDGDARVLVNGRNVTKVIRRPEISLGASRAATLPKVRELLVEQQQRIGGRGGVVMEGRDIGSVVFPRAELKIFLDASVEVRAQRRYEQQLAMGVESSLEKTRREVEERDHRDKTRAVSPLVQAPDAVYLDSTALTAEEVVDVIVRLAEKKVTELKGSRV